VWGIGVDADQSFLGDHVLTSAMKGVDIAVFLTIQSQLDDTFEGGQNAAFGIEQEGVGIGTLSPKANPDDVKAVEDLEQQMVDGEDFKIPTALK
jgi:basic membrane protein A